MFNYAKRSSTKILQITRIWANFANCFEAVFVDWLTRMRFDANWLQGLKGQFNSAQWRRPTTFAGTGLGAECDAFKWGARIGLDWKTSYPAPHTATMYRGPTGAENKINVIETWSSLKLNSYHLKFFYSTRRAQRLSTDGDGLFSPIFTDTFQSADFSFEIELPLSRYKTTDRVVCAVGVGVVLLIERKSFPKFPTLEKVIPQQNTERILHSTHPNPSLKKRGA